MTKKGDESHGKASLTEFSAAAVSEKKVRLGGKELIEVSLESDTGRHSFYRLDEDLGDKPEAFIKKVDSSILLGNAQDHSISHSYGILKKKGYIDDNFDVMPEIREAFKNEETKIFELSQAVKERRLTKEGIREIPQGYEEIIMILEVVSQRGLALTEEWYAVNILYQERVRNDHFIAGYLYAELLRRQEFDPDFRKHRQQHEKLQQGAAEGTQANSRKARERIEVFDRIAMDCWQSWLFLSEKQQLVFIKNRVRQADLEHDPTLFLHGNKLLSDDWFEKQLTRLKMSERLRGLIKK